SGSGVPTALNGEMPSIGGIALNPSRVSRSARPAKYRPKPRITVPPARSGSGSASRVRGAGIARAGHQPASDSAGSAVLARRRHHRSSPAPTTTPVTSPRPNQERRTVGPSVAQVVDLVAIPGDGPFESLAEADLRRPTGSCQGGDVEQFLGRAIGL